MAEYEELVVKVEVKGQQDYKELSQQLKNDFRDIRTVSEESFGRLFRHTGNIGRQIRSLTEGVTTGDAGKAIGNFATTFGRAGGTVGGIVAAITAAMNIASSRAKSLVDLDAHAKRAGIHPAQLMKDIETAQLSGVISRERMIEMETAFGQRIAQLKTGLPEFRKQILNLVALEGDPDPAVRAMINQNVTEVLNSTRPGGLNAVKEFVEKIKKHYEELGHPEFAAKVGEAILSWWGLSGIEQVTEKFKEVDEDSKKNMEAMIEASKAWEKLTGGMKNDFEAIITMLSAMIMDDPILGPILKGIGWVLEKARGAAEQNLTETGELPWWFPRVGDIVMPLGPLGGAAARGVQHLFRRKEEHPGGTATEPQRLMGGEFQKQMDSTEDLVREFTRLNALLSGQEPPLWDLNSALGIKDIGKPGNPPFHNQPMGGAAGESNPIQLPTGDAQPQPGGGASAEAVGPVQGKGWWGAGQTRQKVLQRWGGTTESVTGKGSRYGSLPGGVQDIDPRTGQYQDKPGSASLGQMWGMKYFPEERQGIALPTAETLGRLFRITWPDGSQTIEQHTDIGPAKRLGRAVDVSEAAIARAGKTESFKTDEQFTVEALPTFGQEARMQRAAAAASVGRPGGEGQALLGGVPETTPTSGLRPSVRSYQAAQRSLLSTAQRVMPDIGEAYYDPASGALTEAGRRAGKPENPNINQGQAPEDRMPYLSDVSKLRINPERWEQFLRETPKSSRIEDRRPRDPTLTDPNFREDVDLPSLGGGSAPIDLDRDVINRSLSRDADIQPRGNLNVNVKAPAGTEVKAEGDGMFKGNVSLDRQMELPTLQ